jgi:hypothetical protein
MQLQGSHPSDSSSLLSSCKRTLRTKKRPHPTTLLQRSETLVRRHFAKPLQRCELRPRSSAKTWTSERGGLPSCAISKQRTTKVKGRHQRQSPSLAELQPQPTRPRFPCWGLPRLSRLSSTPGACAKKLALQRPRRQQGPKWARPRVGRRFPVLHTRRT